MDIRYHNTPDGVRFGVQAGLRDIAGWPCTVIQAREAILSDRVVGANVFDVPLPDFARRLMPTQVEVERINQTCADAARMGRLIDFGGWNNAVIKYAANRAGPLYTRGAIGHPFAQPWLFYHRWEDGSACYMVNPLEPDKLAGGECEIVELQPMLIKQQGALMIGDRAVLSPDPSHPDWRKYQATAIPSVFRYFPAAEAINNGQPPENAAAGNVLDPLMTALLMLSTRGIERSTVTAAEKLQKARRKSGKPAIPPYEQVASQAYVSVINTRIARGRRQPSQGGTHASPIAHLRMGHFRTLPSGTETYVRDALVAMSDEARATFQSSRSHYVVKS